MNIWIKLPMDKPNIYCMEFYLDLFWQCYFLKIYEENVNLGLESEKIFLRRCFMNNLSKYKPIYLISSISLYLNLLTFLVRPFVGIQVR
jgi:hypothetical protein